MENFKKLNLGCGETKKVGYINVDWQAAVQPDVIHDLNIFPYPFLDNYFDLIEAAHVLEHLDKPFLAMKEIYRILRPGGELLIKVPHFSRGFTHAEHTHGFDVTFPLYYNEKFTKSGYYGISFKLEKISLRWLAFQHLLPAMGYNNGAIIFLNIINNLINFLANLNVNFCSRIWCFWVGGFDEIEFRFIKK